MKSWTDSNRQGELRVKVIQDIYRLLQKTFLERSKCLLNALLRFSVNQEVFYFALNSPPLSHSLFFLYYQHTLSPSYAGIHSHVKPVDSDAFPYSADVQGVFHSSFRGDTHLYSCRQMKAGSSHTWAIETPLQPFRGLMRATGA